MITLYNFGPAFGLPDPSPFVTKVERRGSSGRVVDRVDAQIRLN